MEYLKELVEILALPAIITSIFIVPMCSADLLDRYELRQCLNDQTKTTIDLKCREEKK